MGALTRREMLVAVTGTALSGCTGSVPGGTTDESTPTPGGSGDSGPPPGATATSPPGEFGTPSAPAFEDPDDVENGVETFRGVPFRETPSGSLRLDLHRPAGADGAPLIVRIHGGGWRTGSRTWDRWGNWHANLGMVAATLDYRLSITRQYPAAVRDVVAGVTWLRTRAADPVGIDPERVALIGESSGAHLSALVGVAPRVDRFRPAGVGPHAAGIDAVVGLSGVYDLTDDAVRDHENLHLFLGCTADECPGRYREASPVAHLDGDDPATLLYHGTDDGILPYRLSTDYRDALREAGVPVTFVTGEGGEHATPYRGSWRDRMVRTQREFLTEWLDLPGGSPVPTPPPPRDR